MECEECGEGCCRASAALLEVIHSLPGMSLKPFAEACVHIQAPFPTLLCVQMSGNFSTNGCLRRHLMGSLARMLRHDGVTARSGSRMDVVTAMIRPHLVQLKPMAEALRKDRGIVRALTWALSSWGTHLADKCAGYNSIE